MPSWYHTIASLFHTWNREAVNWEMEFDWKRSIGNDEFGNGDFGDMATESSGDLKRWSASPQIHRLLSLPHGSRVFCGFLYDHTNNENQERVGFGVEVFWVRKQQQQQQQHQTGQEQKGKLRGEEAQMSVLITACSK